MSTAANIAVALLALLHLYILVLEMFFWDKPAGLRAFDLEPEFARATRTLAANQGLYNGFLAAGLCWALADRGLSGHSVTLFFVGCVLVAGVFGGFTANRKIFLVQAAPAAATLLLVLLS
jgi:putative membrane protein